MGTKLCLYTETAPLGGRAVILAKKLFDVTGLSSSECLRIVTALLLERYTIDNPLTVDIPDGQQIADLEATCAEVGVATSRKEA